MKEPTHFGLHSLIRSPTVFTLVIFLAFGALLVVDEHRLQIVEALAVLLISAACLGVAPFAYRYGARIYDRTASRKGEFFPGSNK